MYLTFFIIINLLAIFCFYLMIKNHRQLTALLKENNIHQDEEAFSFGFINKVFQQFPKQPEISKIQRKIVNYAVYAGLLLLVGRYFIRFV